MLHQNETATKRPPFFPYLLGSTLSAIFENGLFFPTETLSKRLQVAHMQVTLLNMHQMNRLKATLFPNSKTPIAAFASLYQGSIANIVYRIMQRTAMFTGQPMIEYNINQKIGDHIEQQFGEHARTPITNMIAGSASCFLELPFFPLSTISVRMQTQPVSITKAFYTGHLFNGLLVTTSRNLLSAMALFGSAAFARQSLFGLHDVQKASWQQEWIAASIGATIATTLNNPLDVLKTRIQASNGTLSGAAIAKTIYYNDGVAGFMRGLVPRFFTVAPRTAVGMTVANQLAKKISLMTKHGFFKNDHETVRIIEEIEPTQPTQSSTVKQTPG